MTLSDGENTRPNTRNSTRHFRHFGTQGLVAHPTDSTSQPSTILRRSARLNPDAQLAEFQPQQPSTTTMLNRPDSKRNPQPEQTTATESTEQTTYTSIDIKNQQQPTENQQIPARNPSNINPNEERATNMQQ